MNPPFLIVGLGNPGKKYENTRHNAGFLFVDFLQKQWKFPEFSTPSPSEKKFDASTSNGCIDGKRIILAQPETFMNASGKAVRALLSFYKIPRTHLAVIHDDLDIPLGTFRIATNSRSAGHNGVQNIIDCLGSQEFRRFRLGIKVPHNGDERISSEQFVLEPSPPNELDSLYETFSEVLQKIESWIGAYGD